MLYSCACGVTISIPTWRWAAMSDVGLMNMCLQYDSVVTSSNPWINSVKNDGEIGREEDEEYYEEEEDNIVENEIPWEEDNQEGHYESPEYYENND